MKRLFWLLLFSLLPLGVLATQGSVVIGDGTGAQVLTAINTANQVLISDNAGASAPTTTYAYQRWVDTTTGLMKQRNAANSAWITLYTLATGTPQGISAFSVTLLDDANAATARATLDVPSNARLKGTRYGNRWEHDIDDITNDFTIYSGGCMDSAGVYWIETLTTVKQADAAWAYGAVAGMLDTGTIGNNDYYIWAIANPTSGLTDFLSSLSATSPTMPTGYTYKRLVGWFKRVAGVNVLMDVYETEGGGVEVAWRAPTTEVSTSTLTTTRRTDAVKVPLDFSVVAKLTAGATDDVAGSLVRVMCPDESDVAVVAATTNLGSPVANIGHRVQLHVRTSSAGLIAARANLPMSLYTISTDGFSWARRN
jgi:hypothetical protein